MRAQNLFNQVKVFKGQPELLCAGGQERHFVRRIRFLFAAAEDERSDSCFLPWNRNGDDLLKLLALKNWKHHLAELRRPEDAGLGLIGHALNLIADGDGSAVPQEICR